MGATFPMGAIQADDMARRGLNPDEIRGALYALTCLNTWAAQIETKSDLISTSNISLTLNDAMKSGGNMTRALAKAMAISLTSTPIN